MNYYKYNEDYFFSPNQYDLEKVDDIDNAMNIYYLNDFGRNARFIFKCDKKSLTNYSEGINLLFNEYIEENLVTCINTSYPKWIDEYDKHYPKKWRVNIIAMGDVGATLLSGLKLLGGECIDEIGIFDLNENILKRYEMEFNQVIDPFGYDLPTVKVLASDNLFDCDMFIFCASKAVPKVGSNVKDVRMAQFEANKQIVEIYANQARELKYKGIFAVVSDPVDLLSKAAFELSNTNNDNEFDFNGLKPEQVIGYGLGVMNARAMYYAKLKGHNEFIENGRAYGPHGKDLVIVNDIDNYDQEISDNLTKLAVNANKVVRSFGYKPYIAPALSSAAFQIIYTIKGNYNYSSTFIGGTYYGAKNKLVNTHFELEKIKFNSRIFDVIASSYQRVTDLYE